MKDFFKNKINILFTVILVGLVTALGYFGYKLLKTEDKIYVPDFANKTQVDVENWCKGFETNPCTITSDYSDEVEEGKIIYQSISPKEELTDKISFVISLGKKQEVIEITVPEFNEDTSRQTVEEWASQNNLSKITYIEEASDKVVKGNVIKVESDPVINPESEVKVYISSGSSCINEDGIITINKDQFINMSKDRFIKKMEELGLTPSYSERKDAYSSTIETGMIVWHGSGEYIKGEEIHFGLSLGVGDNIEISAGTYVGKTYEEFEAAVKKLGKTGLVPTHKEAKDDYSDKIEKGSIVWHGSGTYDDGEAISYGLSLGKDGRIRVESGQYVGKTYEEFETIVKGLGESGLTPKHKESKDDYSSNIPKGSIVWHGSGTYDEKEEISYGLSLGKDPHVTVESGIYVGKTLSEFETIVKGLSINGLTPTHKESKDAYSETIAKGSIVWHGSGTYDDKENISYGLSLGPVPKVNVTSFEGKSVDELKTFLSNNQLVLGTKTEKYSDSIGKGLIISNTTGSIAINSSVDYVVSLGKDTRVNVGDYSGKAASELESFLSSNGLSGNKTSKYSNSVAEGKIISNDTGLVNAGSTVNYVVSKGPEPEATAHIMRPQYYTAGSTYEATVANIQSALNGFTNVSYVGTEANESVGQILSITVNGNDAYTAGDYPVSTSIVVTICNKTTY